MFRPLLSIRTSCACRPYRWFTIVWIMLVTGAGSLRAQTPIDSVLGTAHTDSTLLRSGNLNQTLFSFDHLLSIYEWHARTNIATFGTPAEAFGTHTNIDTILLLGDSHFLQYNAIRSNSASGFVYADDALFGDILRPMVVFSGNTIASSGVPGLSAATLVPGETDGFGAAGLRYFIPGTNLDGSAAVGLAELKQSGVSATAGTIVRATLEAPIETLGEDAILTSGAMADERFFRLNSERYSSDTVGVSIANPIGDAPLLDSNHAYLNANLDRRDFFYTTDSGSPPIKQEWRELALSIRDSINYPLSGRSITGTIAAALEPSSIERKSDISGSQLSTSSFSAVSSLLVPNEESILHSLIAGRLDIFATSEWDFEGNMSYDDRTQNVQLIGSDLSGIDPSLVSKFATILNESSYDQRITQAGASAVFRPSQRERFQIQTEANLLNYDTPSPLNDDDHDELITSASARYDRYFSDDLHGWLDLRAARTHLVYLLSDRSAQNNVTRSLLLSTHGIYTTSALYAEADGEVFANYTVLDFLDSVPQLAGIGNYVMRGLTLSDSLITPIGIRPFPAAGPITIQEGAQLQISERGSYNESAFSEVISSRITQISATVMLGLSSNNSISSSYAPWNIAAGVRAFFLINEGQSVIEGENGPLFQTLDRQTRMGPIVTVSLSRRYGIGPMLFGSIWYSVLKDQNLESSTVLRTPQTEAQLSAQWTF